MRAAPHGERRVALAPQREAALRVARQDARRVAVQRGQVHHHRQLRVRGARAAAVAVGRPRHARRLRLEVCQRHHAAAAVGDGAVGLVDLVPADAPAVEPARAAGGELEVVVAPAHDVLRPRERRVQQRLRRRELREAQRAIRQPERREQVAAAHGLAVREGERLHAALVPRQPHAEPRRRAREVPHGDRRVAARADGHERAVVRAGERRDLAAARAQRLLSRPARRRVVVEHERVARGVDEPALLRVPQHVVVRVRREAEQTLEAHRRRERRERVVAARLLLRTRRGLRLRLVVLVLVVLVVLVAAPPRPLRRALLAVRPQGPLCG